MTKLTLPAGASLPPAFTAKERADFYSFVGAKRRRSLGDAMALMRLMMPLAAVFLVVSVALTAG